MDRWQESVRELVRRAAPRFGVDAGAVLADTGVTGALAELDGLEPGSLSLAVGVEAVVEQWAGEADRPAPAGAAMVALMLPAEVAETVAVDGGLPAGQLHVTVAYLGSDLTEAQRQTAAEVTGRVAGRHPRLTGQLGGLGMFPAGADGVPVFAPVDVPGLAELRADLVAGLAEAGVPVPAEHDFTPHATLTYLPDGQRWEGETVPPTPVTFDQLTFASDGDRQPFPLGTREATTAGSTQVRDRIVGRVVESRGTDTAGGRVFRVRIIAWGESRNRRRYPQQVMTAAAPLYEGAKAYDHHRSPDEMRTSTIAGLIGSYRNVAAESDGLYGDLHLLPGATHAAQALDASLAAQAEGLAPLVGISHDVLGQYRTVTEGGRNLDEATQIIKVNSADVVADPAAGGMPTRMLAGGGGETINDPEGAAPTGQQEGADVPLKKDDLLAALKECDDAELAGVGLTRATPASSGDTGGAGAAGGEPVDAGAAAAGGTAATAGAAAATEATAAGTVTRAAEAGSWDKGTFMAQMMIRHKVEAAQLPIKVVESVTEALPQTVTEAAVDAQISAIKAGLAAVERAGLVGASQLGAGAKVTQESLDKKRTALDKFFAGEYRDGYRSFKEAWADVTGHRPTAWGEDLNRQILRECFGAGFDSAVRGTESLDSSSWASVLGDSITRRMIAMYAQPSLQGWRKIVSDRTPISDFRQQRRTRIGGYGLLPVVNEGAPYQPLQSPGDEEAVFTVIKRGGTDDLTLEAIANDDLAAIRNIPRLLGLAAGITLYRFVFDILANNATCTYDSTALFHANHNNTTTAALSSSALSGARRRMRQQAAFGNAVNILSLKPALLLVPSALEELAFQLTASAVAITGSSDATIPNLHRGLDMEVVDYWSDDDDWFLSADPAMAPSIEIGFYQGREDPEIFTQADQNTGSMFNADKFTYKIRHAYDGTPLDHRWVQRGVQ